MTEHPITEVDLREALRSTVPDDLDATDFRARLDRLLADPPTGRPRSAGAGPIDLAPEVDGGEGEQAGEVDEIDEVLDLTTPRTPTGPRRARRVAALASVAACAAAVVAVAVAVVPFGHSGRRTPPGPAATAPAAIRSLLYPGTIVLRTYRGQGSRTYPVAPRTVPAHFGYAAYGTCRGGGDLTIAQETSLNACADPSPIFISSAAVQHDRLTVTADTRASWQITLVLAPDPRTNGSVQSGVDPDLSGMSSELRRSGKGSATVRFGTGILGDEPPAAARYRLQLVCRGAGVRLPDLRSDRANGLQTATCFAGWQYVWSGLRLTLPTDVRVVAPVGTTWTIVLVST